MVYNGLIAVFIINLLINKKNMKKSVFNVATLSFLLIASSALAVATTGKGKEISAEHKSNVAKVVETLTALAGKDKNIGEEVRAVAQEQATSSDRVAEAIDAVETHGWLKTFLFGTDYKNLGALRSEIVTTENSISRLTKAMERTTDPAVKADLETQIKALQDANAKALEFIKTNESKFSLFGWVMRLLQ